MSPKVAAGAGAAGGSTPVSILIIWILTLAGVTVPPDVSAAIAALTAALSSLLAGYYTPHPGLGAPANDNLEEVVAAAVAKALADKLPQAAAA